MVDETVTIMLQDIDERDPLENNAAKVIQFMLDSCDLLRDELPPVADEALAMARQYWAGAAEAIELEQARIKC